MTLHLGHTGADLCPVVAVLEYNNGGEGQQGRPTVLVAGWEISDKGELCERGQSSIKWLVSRRLILPAIVSASVWQQRRQLAGFKTL